MSNGVRSERHRNLVLAISRFLIRHPFKGSVRIEKAVGQLLLPRPTGPTLARTQYGFDLCINPVVDRGLETALYYRGTYEPGTLWIIENCLRAGDSFYDVGGNIGLMTVFGARRVGPSGRVMVFEPDVDTYQILQGNIGLNQLKNVQAWPMALGSRRETLPLHRHSGNRGRSSLATSDNTDKGISVDVQTLDDFLAEHPGDLPRMIKIDVEGWELKVLRGAACLLDSPDAPILCVEYSHRAAQGADVLNDLYQYICSLSRYKIFRLAYGKERISRLTQVSSRAHLPYEDNLFCFTSSHLSGLPRDLFR